MSKLTASAQATVFISILFSVAAHAENPLPTPEEARKFMAGLKCELGFFFVYRDGKFKGRASPGAICIASYDEGGARKHPFCYARPLDLLDGTWGRDQTYGSVYRVEGTHCSKAAIKKLFSWQGGAFVAGVRFKAASADIEVVGDTFEYANALQRQFRK